MSDNAEKYLNRLDIWDHPRITNRNETESYDVTELMQSYAEHHLEDVLWDLLEEMSGVLPEYHKELVEDELNLLKQRKG